MSISAAPTVDEFLADLTEPFRFNDNAVAGPSTLPASRRDSPELRGVSPISSRASSLEFDGKGKGKGKAKAISRRVRSSLSRTSSTASTHDRITESAHQARVRAEVAKGRRNNVLYNYLFWGLRFVVEHVNPFRLLAWPTPQVREGSPAMLPIDSFLSFLVSSSSANSPIETVIESRTDACLNELDDEAIVEAEAQPDLEGMEFPETENAPAMVKDGNVLLPPGVVIADPNFRFPFEVVHEAPLAVPDTHPDDGDDASDGSTELVGEEENDPPMKSEPLQYVDEGLGPEPEQQPDPFALPLPGPYWTPGRLERQRACRMFKLEDAENLAKKRMAKERFNEAQNTWILDTFGEVDGHRLLLDFEWMDFADKAHERTVNGMIDMIDEKERSLLLQSGAEAAFKEVRDRDRRIRRKLRAKQRRSARMLGLDRIGYRQDRDKKFKFRRIRRARFHPYSSCVRPAGRVLSRYFNQSGASGNGPAFQDEPGASLRPEVDLDELYRRYHDQWVGLTHPENDVELTFETVPWPVARTPKSPADIISEDVKLFVQGNYDWDDDDCVAGGLRELRRWMPDRFENWVLRRIPDEEEREAVREGADIVRKTLVWMVSIGYKEQHDEAHITE